jgi:hypothetical protein
MPTRTNLSSKAIRLGKAACMDPQLHQGFPNKSKAMADFKILLAIVLRQTGRVAGFVFLCAAISASLLYVAGMFVGLVPGPWTCVTLERETIPGPDGMTIEMTLTNCDLIAKWERVVVVARQRGNLRKTRLFEYDPPLEMPFPQITFSDNNDLHITIPAILSVNFQSDFWNGHRVIYHIGKIYYPEPDSDSFVPGLAPSPGDAR